ncbi:MAG: hypothetical protein QM638_13590 [Nocardioides sp.]|uniref:hypothetical protein n=1 Tax=Nocardioides sp. TaxID=35761 RepID=UPI0039E395CC
MTAGTGAENPRARRRRVLYLAGLLPLLVALAFTVEVVTMRSHDRAGGDAWRQANGPRAFEEYDANRAVNLLEPWIAHFDAGDAAFLLADHQRARDLFTEALRSVPSAQECTVRINLALADEAIGDDAAADAADGAVGDTGAAPTDAQDSWRAGIAALTEGGCPTDAGQGERQSRQAAAVKERLERKLDPPPSTSARHRRHPKDGGKDRERSTKHHRRQQHKNGTSSERNRTGRSKEERLAERNRQGSRERAKQQSDDGSFGYEPSW